MSGLGRRVGRERLVQSMAGFLRTEVGMFALGLRESLGETKYFPDPEINLRPGL